MRRKVRKKKVNQELLDAIFNLENEWKQIQYMVENSIEPTDDMMYQENLAQVKYMFLLMEARHRNLTALRY